MDRTPVTLFTGDTIASLQDIMAIGPPMQQVKHHDPVNITRKAFIVIHLKTGIRLEYTPVVQELFSRATAQDNAQWNEAVAQLGKDREELVNAWTDKLNY